MLLTKNIKERTLSTIEYLVEVEEHVVAEVAGAEQLTLLGDLQAIGHRNGVEHLSKIEIASNEQDEALNRHCK